MKPFRHQNSDRLLETARTLGDLTEELVFVGGATVGLLITDPAIPGLRTTYDVDATVELAGRVAFYQLQERLRDKGYSEVMEDGVICRWKRGELILDVMPTRKDILGFTNRWYKQAVAHSKAVLIDDVRLRVITVPYFLGTKLEAFYSRGGGDLLASHDLEDFVAVLDGCLEVIDDVSRAESEIKNYLVEHVGNLLDNDDFMDALPGHLFPDPSSQRRASMIVDRMRQIAAMKTE